MKIYTKQGDTGQTSLFGGTKISKNHIRIEAYGTIDELNSFLGLLGDRFDQKERINVVQEIQNALFVIGSNLATEDPDKFSMQGLSRKNIDMLETGIDSMEEDLKPLKNFILPGGHETSSLAQVCRVICRRAERRVVALSEVADIDPLILEFLNRLSDYFFVLARYILMENNSQEIYWKSGDDA